MKLNQRMSKVYYNKDEGDKGPVFLLPDDEPEEKLLMQELEEDDVKLMEEIDELYAGPEEVKIEDKDDDPEKGETAPNKGDDENLDDDPDNSDSSPESGDDTIDNEGDGKDKEVKVEEDEAITTVKNQIAALTKLVEKMSSTKEPEPVPKEPEVKTPELNFEEFFKEVDFDAVMESKEEFFKFLVNFAGATQKQYHNQLMGILPEMVGTTIKSVNTHEQIGIDFYEEHKELKPVKKYVSEVAVDIARNNPEMNLSEVLAEAAKRTKEELGISSLPKTEKKDEKEEKKPTDDKSGKEKKVDKKGKLPKATTTRRKGEQVSALQKEIDEL